jgi:hypothetical protein
VWGGYQKWELVTAVRYMVMNNQRWSLLAAQYGSENVQTTIVAP